MQIPFEDGLAPIPYTGRKSSPTGDQTSLASPSTSSKQLSRLTTEPTYIYIYIYHYLKNDHRLEKIDLLCMENVHIFIFYYLAEVTRFPKIIV